MVAGDSCQSNGIPYPHKLFFLPDGSPLWVPIHWASKAVGGRLSIPDLLQADEEKPGRCVDPVAAAIAIKKKHPDWSDRKIARKVGCSHTTLIGAPIYRQVRAMFAADAPPLGHVENGQLDAESDE